MIPAARRSLYDVLLIVSSQVTLFLKKKLPFFFVAAVFNSTDVFKRCIDRYLNRIWKIALLVMSTVMYHNDVSTSMNCKHRGLRSGTGVIFFLRNAGAGKQTLFWASPTPWKSPSAQQQTHSTPKLPWLLTSRKPENLILAVPMRRSWVAATATAADDGQWLPCAGEDLGNGSLLYH